MGALIVGALIAPDYARYNRTARNEILQSVLGIALGEFGVGFVGFILARAVKTSDIPTIMISVNGLLGAPVVMFEYKARLVVALEVRRQHVGVRGAGAEGGVGQQLARDAREPLAGRQEDVVVVGLALLALCSQPRRSSSLLLRDTVRRQQPAPGQCQHPQSAVILLCLDIFRHYGIVPLSAYQEGSTVSSEEEGHAQGQTI